jgi:hypothetical protein
MANFSTPTSVALIGTTAWVTEGNTTYFYLDPDYEGEDHAKFRWGKNRE